MFMLYILLPTKSMGFKKKFKIFLLSHLYLPIDKLGKRILPYIHQEAHMVIFFEKIVRENFRNGVMRSCLFSK